MSNLIIILLVCIFIFYHKICYSEFFFTHPYSDEYTETTTDNMSGLHNQPTIWCKNMGITRPTCPITDVIRVKFNDETKVFNYYCCKS